jgi:isopenicillin N synthase-like dioxygenase
MDIPTIDLLPFYSSEKHHIVSTANKIASACQTIGAFYVTNSTLPTFSNDYRTLQQLMWFFELPLEIKNKISGKNNLDHRGYGFTDDSGSDEVREWVYVGDEEGDSYEKNQWLEEEELPQWKHAIENLFKLLTFTGKLLYQAFSLALGKDKNFLEETFRREPTVLLLRYPSGGKCPEHTDVGFLAINLLDPVGGLQIKPRGSNDWIDVPARENTFLCHIGDALERVTNGLWYSVPHRVRHETPGYRYGVVMFNNPHAESVIASLDESLENSLDENDPAKLPPIVYKDFHQRRLNELKY